MSAKKYEIRFTANYLDYEEWANDGEQFYGDLINVNKKELERCKKWTGKKITILELEDLITEFGKVVFDGKMIEVYNDLRE